MTPDITNAKVLAWNALTSIGCELAVSKAAEEIAPHLENDEMKIQLGFAMGLLAALIIRPVSARLSDGC